MGTDKYLTFIESLRLSLLQKIHNDQLISIDS